MASSKDREVEAILARIHEQRAADEARERAVRGPSLAEQVPERLRKGMKPWDYAEYLDRKFSRRSLLRGAVVLGAAATAGPVLWSRPGLTQGAAVALEGVRLQYGTEPSRAMTVSWMTKDPVQAAKLELGVDATYGTVVPVEPVSYRDVLDSLGNGSKRSSLQYHAPLAGLEPGTTYHYRLSHAGGAPFTGTFRTAPADVAPFRFTAFGDHGSSTITTSPSGPVAVQRLQALDPAPAFHVHAGDIGYSCGSSQTMGWDDWHREVQPMASGVPWMPSPGNHEAEIGYGVHGFNPYRTRFHLPHNGTQKKTDRWASMFYAFRYSNVLVIALDGNDAAREGGYDDLNGWLGGAQERWLERVLRAARLDPKVDWIVAHFHHCMYCTDPTHGSDGGCRERWQPLFDRYKVDLVVNGHNHCYERTYPTRGDDWTETLPGQPVDPHTMGVTYVVTGASGNIPRTASVYPQSIYHENGLTTTRETGLWRAARYDSYHVTVVDVDPGAPGGKTTMRVWAQDFSGNEVDSVVLERPARAILSR